MSYLNYPIGRERFEEMDCDEREEYLAELADQKYDYAEDAEIMEGLD